MSVPNRLIEDSSLTRTQVESLEVFARVLSHELSLREAAGLREDGAVTVGSYYRTVLQARKKIRSSVLTLIIAQWLGVVNVENLRRLLDLAGKGVSTLGEEEKERLVDVLDALLDKIVM